jgi:RNA polymerase sigma factor (sigma-70 family)
VSKQEESDSVAPEGLSDSALVQACLTGDERAWEELVERYGRLVYSIPRRMGLPAADADDVFQNVFSALLRHLAGLRDQTRLAPWLITTTRRESWRHGRSSARFVALDDSIVDQAPEAIEDVTRWEREQGVRQAMRRLDARCRALLSALFLDNTASSYEAVAARLGMPIGSIGPTRARCFRKLDAILRELGFNGSP